MKSALIRKAELIVRETEDLMNAIAPFEDWKEKHNGEKPHMGDGAEWKSDGYGVTHCVKDGFPQGSTVTAIERKIITIRDHLNELRKLVIR